MRTKLVELELNIIIIIVIVRMVRIVIIFFHLLRYYDHFYFFLVLYRSVLRVGPPAVSTFRTGIIPRGENCEIFDRTRTCFG